MFKKATPVILLVGIGALAGVLLASACPGGVKSHVCKEYFDRAEACAAKSPPDKAAMLRSLAKFAEDGFKNNQNKPGVEDSCREMLTTLESDPDCK